MAKNSYKQHLPAIGLSLERYTDAVPDDGAYYLLRDGEQLGRYRSLTAAKEAWTEAVASSGWTVSKRELDTTEITLRERRERWARNRAG
jgi:hypothetical protein